jgi:class 3 adenylate cyclase
MNRKIAAIVAADIAGYSKLVAEDEEETLRRLASYRSVFEDFITRFSGRIFNTAGDAVLAEFPSAVEAVRCAIDVQESIRTRNLAYPSSRQMSFRIGITIGDVVERDGDLLGDGVNIAARLEGLAQPGGVCVSRTVYEQVANKLSVEFVDIGEQSVKNIPTPIHAYAVALGGEDPRLHKPPQQPNKVKGSTAFWPIAITAASVAVLAVTGLVYQTVANTNARSNAPTPVAAVEQNDRARTAPRPAEASVTQLVPPPAADRLRFAENADGQSISEHKPCIEIRTACEQAGFAPGGVREGSGIFVDCIRPIMQGMPQPRSASRPLPQVDPQVVAACRLRNPRFGEIPPGQVLGRNQWPAPFQPRMMGRP